MKIQEKLKNISIFSKISILTILLIIVSSVISNIFQISHFTENLKDKNRLLVSEAASHIESNILNKYNIMYNQRTLIHSTDHIASTISSTRDNPSEIYQADNLKKITEYLTALCYSDNHILDAVIFTSDGENAFSYSNASGRRIYLNYDYNTLPYIEEFHDSSETILAVYDEAPPYLTLASKGDPSVITFIGKLYDMNYPTKKIITGYLMINYSPSSIDSVYNEIDTASDGQYLIVNGLSDIIYANDPSYLNSKYNEELFPPEDILLDKTISLSKLRIIGAISDKALMKNIRSMIWKLTAVTVASIACLVIIIAILHKYYKEKFHQLAAAMNQISQGDFDTKLPVNSQDEIGYLSRAFNNMSETLDDYIKKTYLAETRRRTAELYALQAQINPHFLANTIESIRMRALTDGNYELNQMLANLGNLFRWMIQFHQDIIYLEDEIDYIDSYLDLQKFRFGNKLHIKMNIPPDTLYLGIPRFTMQPIVENSLTHGLPQDGRPLTIDLSLRIETDTLILTIKDDGAGMDEETLAGLKAHIADTEENADFGIAIKNVHKRIQLLFGEQYGIAIRSKLQQGTIIDVTIPALPKKEMERYV